MFLVVLFLGRLVGKEMEWVITNYNSDNVEEPDLIKSRQIKSKSSKCDVNTLVKNPWPNTILGRPIPADINIAGQ